MPNFLDSIPKVTKNLLIINVLAYMAYITFIRFGIDLNNILGLHYFRSSEFNAIQFVTYMFLHASFSHIFFNMFALFMFGRIIESIIGAKKYIIFYFTCGIGAGLIQEITWMYSINDVMSQISIENGLAELNKMQADYIMSQFVTVGASGAIFGLLLAFAMLLPNEPIFLWFFPIPIKSKYFVAVYAILELWGGVSPSAGDNVAHFAHLGGMIFGFLLIKYWEKKYKGI